MSNFDLTFPVDTLSDFEHVDRCDNLRPHKQGGLQAVGMPRCVVSFGPGEVEVVPGGCFTLRDGTRCMLVCHDGVLKAVVGDEGSVATLGDLGGVPSSVVCIDNAVIVMPSDGAGEPRRFACDDTDPTLWQETPLFPSLPPLMIARHDVGVSAVYLPAMTLKGDYTTNTQSLDDTDQASLDKALREAYVNLCDKAMLEGRYIQPVIARYRLIGEGGRVLYTSAPVMVSPDDGLQAVKPVVELYGDGLRSVEKTLITAKSFVPAIEYVDTPDDTWKSLVRSVELQVSPQLHPYSSVLPGHTSQRWTTNQRMGMMAVLPGLDPLNEVAAPGTRIESIVKAILDNLDSALMPYGAMNDTRSEVSRLAELALLGQTTQSPDGEQALALRMAPPHRFSARAVARSGDMVAWGGVRVIPFEGYSLTEMAIGSQVAGYNTPTAVRVEMRDGSSVVRQTLLSKRHTPQLSPLLAYPSAEAVKMKLVASDMSLDVELAPTVGGSMAFYLSPDLKPVSMRQSAGGFVLPSASPATYDYPSALAVCKVACPLEPIAVTYGDGADVRAMLPALRQSNSFTVPSARFYVFGSGGVSSMALTDSRRRVNLNLLDPRPVEGSGAVTPMDGGVAVIAGGALLRVKGSGVETLLERCPAREVGWCGSFRELWCLSPEGEVAEGCDAQILDSLGEVSYTRSGLDVKSAVSTGAGMMILTSGSQLLDASKEVDGPVKVRHVSKTSCNFKPGSNLRLMSGIFGRDIKGKVCLLADHGRPEGASIPLTTFLFTGGDSNHPLTAAIRALHCHYLTLDIGLAVNYPSTFKILRP